MNVKIFADGADLRTMATLVCDGFTTNPSLLKKSGITDYHSFAIAALALAHGRPVSFEVLADDAAGMERQAQEIAGWGDNIFVKIPICNTAGESTEETIERLSLAGVRVNVTALFTKDQIRRAANAIEAGILSVFAGRIADTGRDPEPIVRYALQLTAARDTQVLWASTREVFNVVQADNIGCDIITCAPELLRKLPQFGRDLSDYSLETVRQFYEDGKGYAL
ncbi:MAG: hypothetical protein NUV51_03755 [Sulfuricaulis sp.]|nr:hypothetical protein [Sulfuricaulis sp.]